MWVRVPPPAIGFFRCVLEQVGIEMTSSSTVQLATDNGNTSCLLSLRASGPLACMTRPEFKTERVSYPVLTPSAARGILDAILWKPAMRWRIEKIKVLSPVKFTSFRRNEVGTVATAPSRKVIQSGGHYNALVVEDRRQQRNTVALRDVDYIIEAQIELTDRAEADDTFEKFTAMFRRRLEKGQHFHQPYFGCREFIANVEPVSESAPAPIQEDRDLGVMLWDIDFSQDRKGKAQNRPVFFAATMEGGIIKVPPNAEAAEASLREVHDRARKGAAS